MKECPVLGLQHDRILMYHGTPRRDAAALERQLGLVKLAFPVVPLDELLKKKARRARVALTFDDGLRSNVDVAYPILRKLGLAATFFVCPGLIERGQWLWNHEARERLRSLDPRALAELAQRIGGPDRVEPVVEWMKTLAIAARRQAEDEIRAALQSARRHYGSAVTTELGRLQGDIDPHRLPRYAATPGWNRRLARRMVFG